MNSCYHLCVFYFFLIIAKWNFSVVLICISLMASCWESFHVVIGHSYIFFGEMSILIFHPLFDWVVCVCVCVCVCVFYWAAWAICKFNSLFPHQFLCLQTTHILLCNAQHQSKKAHSHSKLLLPLYLLYLIVHRRKGSFSSSVASDSLQPYGL